ncbi:MAG: Hint domain-containing protein [Chloroflexota bacterium]
MKRRILLIGAALTVILAACGSSGTPSPSPSPMPTPGPARSVTELKLAIISTYGPLWYCDRDFYPIQRQDEIQSAKERWAEVTADGAAFKAIADAVGIDPAGPFTDDQRLTLYRSWKVVQAIVLDSIGNDTYRFDYLAQPKSGGAEGTRTGGRIGADGSISVEQQVAATEPICPICLARGALIEAPDGGVAVEDLRIGDPIWTLDASGRRIEGTVIAIGSTIAPLNHRVVHLILADGRTVTASPGHPLADGRQLGDLRVGDMVGGSIVASAAFVAYEGGRTFDLVVSGPTGTYLVDGIPLGSTLRP